MSTFEDAKPQLVVFSGAGLSAESGLATFRGAKGLWENTPLDKVCNFSTWEKNFAAVHEFYDARRIAVAEAKPNPAHLAVAAWQKQWPERVHVVTQNVDRLLEQSGCHPVIHLHGDVFLMHCVACDIEWEIAGAAYDQTGCPRCREKKTVKPGVVFFKQAAPQYELLYALAADLRPMDTAVVVGTSGTVLPADQIFGRSRAFSILVNLEPGSEMDEKAFNACFFGPAAKILFTLTETIQKRMEANPSASQKLDEKSD
jgi:NAD-dependent deacetylase